MRFRADWLALPCLLIALAPVHADDLSPPDDEGSAEEPLLEEARPLEDEATTVPIGTASIPDPQPTPGPGTMELTLDAAVQLALQNNLNVEVQRFGPLIFAENQTIAWGEYDPEFFADFGYESFKDPNSFGLNDLDGGDSVTRVTDGFGGFRGLIPLLGSSYDFHFTGSRETTNSSIQSLSPALRSSFSLSLTQPLLKGLWWNEPWTRVKKSQLSRHKSLEEFRQSVMDVVQDEDDGSDD